MLRLLNNTYIFSLAIMIAALGMLLSCNSNDGASTGASIATNTPTSSAEPTPTLVNYTEDRQPCDCRSETKNLYWGELHAHTILSYDAYGWGTTVTPEQAYKFAKGGSIALTARDSDITQYIRLSRPLDFAALTDHQEYLPETYLCSNENSGAYNCQLC